MFTEEEATAVVLGLLGSAWLEIGLSSVAVEGALAKITRVLPIRARERLQAVSTNMTLWSHDKAVRPAASLLLNLSEAIQQQQRIALVYRSHQSEVTQRTVEPYGITGWRGLWYLVGYCCLRQGYRVFRLDRMQHLEVLEEGFTKDDDFDYRAYMLEYNTATSASWKVQVTFAAPLPVVQEKIPTSYGTLTATATGVLFEAEYDDLADMARYLMSLNLPFVIANPPELREALLRLAERMVQFATAQHSATSED